jgi:hypothetical protein
MTAAGATGPLDTPDDEQPLAAGGVLAGGDPGGAVEQRSAASDAEVLPLRPGTRPDGERGRSDRRWVFHGEVRTISGPEADRIRAELADVIRDLLLWAAGEAAGTDTSDEEAA